MLSAHRIIINLLEQSLGITPGSGGTPGTFVSVYQPGGAVIPAGALSWSVSAAGSGVTVDGVSVPSGQTIKGGGYQGLKLKTAKTVLGALSFTAYDIPG